DLFVLLWLEVAEGEVFQLPLDLPHAEAVRQRRENFLRFECDAATLFGIFERPERPHVVEPVAELDEYDADVFGHGQEELAQVLRLDAVTCQLIGGGEGHRKLFELGQAVDATRYIRAETLSDDLVRNAAIFLDIVEKRRGERTCIELEFSGGKCYRHRVGNVGIAGLPQLPSVALGGEFVGIAQELKTVRGEVFGGAAQHGIKVVAPSYGFCYPSLHTCHLFAASQLQPYPTMYPPPD